MGFIDRFEYKKNKGCWDCVSHKKDAFGYPRAGFLGKNTPVHRIIYTKEFGCIGKGLLVRHTCDNPACINPKHLLLGTIQDNIRDRDLRGRTSRVARTNGEINGLSKTTSKEVLKIRSLRNKKTQTEIAKMFGLSQTHVSGIQTGRYWSHLGGGLNA